MVNLKICSFFFNIQVPGRPKVPSSRARPPASWFEPPNSSAKMATDYIYIYIYTYIFFFHVASTHRQKKEKNPRHTPTHASTRRQKESQTHASTRQHTPAHAGEKNPSILRYFSNKHRVVCPTLVQFNYREGLSGHENYTRGFWKTNSRVTTKMCSGMRRIKHRVDH